jgi:C_GCAxxG_C_C family probable redox protein
VKVTPTEKIERVKKQAVANFKSGLNCAESVFLALHGELDTDLPAACMCLVTGFGSGGGLFGGTCGSINGAIAAVGLVYGRRQPPSGSGEEKKAQLYGNPGLYRLYNRLANAFQAQFGTTLCRDITRPWHGDWFARERLKTCLKTVAFMAETAAVMVFPADLEYWGAQPWGQNLLEKPPE